jgi:hypothetical protein
VQKIERKTFAVLLGALQVDIAHGYTLSYGKRKAHMARTSFPYLLHKGIWRGALEVYLHLFLTSALGGGKWLTSLPGHFTSGKNPGTLSMGGSLGPKANVNVLVLYRSSS